MHMLYKPVEVIKGYVKIYLSRAHYLVNCANDILNLGNILLGRANDLLSYSDALLSRDTKSQPRARDGTI